jgi:hypothetical protein
MQYARDLCIDPGCQLINVFYVFYERVGSSQCISGHKFAGFIVTCMPYI